MGHRPVTSESRFLQEELTGLSGLTSRVCRGQLHSQIRQEQPKEQVKRLAVVETYPPLLGLQAHSAQLCDMPTC